MRFGNKHSFSLLFLTVFFVTLFGLGFVQAIFGTLRLYNSSEEKHEQLSPRNIYAVNSHEKKSLFVPSNTQNELDPGVFFAAHSEDIKEAIKTLPTEKASKINIRVAQAEESLSPMMSEQVPSKSEEVFQTPVELKVVPDKYSMPSGYANTINTVLIGKYFRDTLWDFPIIVDRSRTSPRGQMSNESVTLSGKILSLSELAKVLVHELGHIVDIYVLRQEGFRADPSQIFYSISWSEPTVMKSGESSAAFVSGYAASNQYEDFAESFAMYIFHNKTFQTRAAKNVFLQQKYNFLQMYIFGDLFLNSAYEKDPVPSKIWDVTKVVIRTNALSDVFTAMRGIVTRAIL